MIENSEINEISILLFGGYIIGLMYAVLPQYQLSYFVFSGIVVAFTLLMTKY